MQIQIIKTHNINKDIFIDEAMTSQDGPIWIINSYFKTDQDGIRNFKMNFVSRPPNQTIDQLKKKLKIEEEPNEQHTKPPNRPRNERKLLS